MQENLSSQSIVVAAKDQVSCDLEDEVAILNLNKGIYYGLDQIGAHVWRLVQEPRSVEDICNEIVQNYEVDPQSCRDDMLSLLDQLCREGLIEVRDNTVGEAPSKSR